MNYSEFPPYKYFIRVIKNCPKSANVYIELWKKKNKSQQIEIDKKKIRQELFISPTLFRNLLLSLVTLNLLQFEETMGAYKIDLLGMTNEK